MSRAFRWPAVSGRGARRAEVIVDVMETEMREGARSRRPQGMTAFTIIWMGQVVSLIGTAMSEFALTLWAYRTTGLATALSMVAFFSFAPTIIIGPVAGVLVDRWNRKWTMALSDLAAALMTLVVLVLFLAGRMQLWHLYVTGGLTGIFQTFQWPAYSAAISMMVPKAQYQRASGMISMAESGASILAPILAGALVGMLGFPRLWVIFGIDLATFLVALGTLSVVAVPNPQHTASLQHESILRQSMFGFRFIVEHRPLLHLQTLYFISNLVSTLCATIFPALILARTGNNATSLGSVQSAGAVGGVACGALLAAWGGPKRRIRGVLLGQIISALGGFVLVGIGRSLPVWMISAFIGWGVSVILNGSSQAIWQSKVPPALQGRVFSARRFVAQISVPVSMLASGPLADKVFGPAMMQTGALASSFGWLTGTGPGAGIALMCVWAGIAGAGLGIAGYLDPLIAHVEDLVPDHDAQAGEGS